MLTRLETSRRRGDPTDTIPHRSALLPSGPLSAGPLTPGKALAAATAGLFSKHWKAIGCIACVAGGAGPDHLAECRILRLPVAIAAHLSKIGRKLVKGLVPGNEFLGNGSLQILLVLRRHGLLQDETVMDLLCQTRDAGVVSSDQGRNNILAGLLDRRKRCLSGTLSAPARTAR